MKSVKANLLNDVVSSYDQTKTTIQGRVFEKTIDGADVLGPPLNQFVDVVNDSIPSLAGGVIPVLTYLSPNGRLFSVNAENSGLIFITCHTIDLDTGSKTYNGTIRARAAEIATTTHTYRGFKVLDNGTTGWRIFLATTASVLISGGLFCVNNVDLADFVSVGFTDFPFATGSNQKATYLLQDPANIGVNQLNVAAAGTIIDRVNNRVYVHNGVSATHQYYVYSSNATLNCPLSTGLVIDSVADTVTQVAHGYNNNDPVFLTNLTGGAGLTNNTNYFVRNVTADTYQLSGTTGGAAINITTNGTVDVCRSFGTTGSAFIHKTGNLPALSGTLVSSDSEDYAEPGHTINAGQPCAFFCTATNLYLGRLSELTSGATTWASLVTSNILGSVNEVTAPILSIATWSSVLDKAFFITNTNVIIGKQVQNNVIDLIFAGSNNKYRETFATDSVELGWASLQSATVAATALDVEDGWIVISPSTVGQRGAILCDLRSNENFDYSYIVTPVLNTPDSVYKYITTTDKLFEFTGSLRVQYRTSGFGSITGGWTDIDFAADISSFTPGAQVQFKILFDTLGLDTCIHAQIQEFYLGLESLFEVSENWEISRDNSSNLTPSRVAYRLKYPYSSSVPRLYQRIYDLSSNLLNTMDTVTDIANVEYSTDNGVSWLALGTIPNTVGTLIRFTLSSPPGIDIRPSLKES